MPKAFDEMRMKMLSSLRGKKNPRTGKPYSESDIYAIAVAQWKKMHGAAPKHEDLIGFLKEDGFTSFEYYVPVGIKESKEMTEGFRITGIAIDETVSRNGIKYEAAELQKAADTLIGRPLLNSHRSEDIKDIMGVVKDAHYNSDKRAIEFEADVMDKEAEQRLRDGRIKNVSIGARFETLENNDSFKTPRGLEFLELSLVAVPGVKNASINQGFDQILSEKFDFLKEIEAELKYMEETQMETQENNTSLESQMKALTESHSAKVKEFEAKIIEITAQKDSLQKVVDEIKAKEKSMKVASIVEAEIKAGIIKAEDKDSESKELMSLSEESLDVISKRMPKISESVVAVEKSKAKVETQKIDEKDEADDDLVIERDGSMWLRSSINPKKE